MRKKGLLRLIPVLMTVCLVTGSVTGGTVLASEESGYEESYDGSTEEETEEPIPESYYLPIESNEVEGWPQGPQIEAEAAVVMDADTGTFLYSKNMDAKEYPASITKIMTALVAIENGDLNSQIVFSENAVYNLEEGSSHTGIQPGEKMTLRKALYGLMLVSANDAANGIAEHIAGSNEGFADLMNAEAASLGCVNTHFVNPHGLHSEEHYTCARDMALITQEALKNRTFRKIFRTYSYTCPETNKVDEKRYWVNHDKMLTEGELPYEGCIGGKTGFTSDALNTLVTVAERDDRTLIAVILRVNGAMKAYDETKQILDYGFQNFKNIELDYAEANMTKAGLLGMDTLGESRVLYRGDLDTKVLEGDNQLLLSVPVSSTEAEVQVALGSDMKLNASFHGWTVGETQLALSSPDYQVPVPDSADIAEVKEKEASVKTGAAAVLDTVVSTAEKIPSYLISEIPIWVEAAQDAWYDLMDFIYDNDIMAAVICFLAIIFLMPFLIIAFLRNSKAQKIRKMRKKEREERVRREADIDRKSVSQIEQELRMELEKARIQRDSEMKRDPAKE